MYTDSQLARDVESHYDLTQDRHDEEGARQDWHAARVEEVREPLERRMVCHPTDDELVQAMASVLAKDASHMTKAWVAIIRLPVFERSIAFANLGAETYAAISVELRKMAETAAEDRVQREEREQEGEARRVRRVRLGDEL
jgi:hypothetical protein